MQDRKTPTVNWVYSALIFFVTLFAGAVLHAESCSGPTYTVPNCSGNCPQANCQDISMNQDGSLFQCCPPVSTPEMPKGMNPLYLALALLLLISQSKRLKRLLWHPLHEG